MPGVTCCANIHKPSKRSEKGAIMDPARSYAGSEAGRSYSQVLQAGIENKKPQINTGLELKDASMFTAPLHFMGRSDCSARWHLQNATVYADPNLLFITEFTDLSFHQVTTS